MSELILLKAGEAECRVSPDVGGSILAWGINGQDMLRRANAGAIELGDPLLLASFPLVPFSNRIGYGKFEWQGETIEIDPNFEPEPHAIHGIGWKMPWRVVEQSETHCVLDIDHKADARWPWPFSAKQTIQLTEATLEITLEAVNLCDQPVPLAFGHHPYFDQRGAYLAFNAKRVFMADENALPTHASPATGNFDFSQGERVEGRDIDHCYADWDGDARIIWEDRPLGVILKSNMPAAVVYIPRGGSAFCFEPVPHINNALNQPDADPAMPVIQPGSNYRSTITMTALAAAKI